MAISQKHLFLIYAHLFLNTPTGLSSRKVNSWFSDNKLMYKKDDNWITNKRRKEVGGIEKEGQYGKFVIWPENIAKQIAE